ncbi:MAG: MBL fold metallo-hydrolase [Campylobacteraceae bacterium]|nr:MBL fold metallo-hydrolase [Campylobacteraceae bacterium]
MAKVTSYGAAEVVTGSAHLLEIENGAKILIDCGMFQGTQSKRNQDEFGFHPKDIKHLLLTHAHLDHVGRIPKLVKEGFSGTIVATAPTCDLAEVILMDSVKLMTQDYQTRFRKAQRKGRESEVVKPLYEEKDVQDVFNLPWVYPKYNEEISLSDDIKVRYLDAGHILGSAFIEISYKERGVWYKIVFSGDLGNDNDMVLPILQKCENADYLYVESTYGDRNHKNIVDSLSEFRKIVIDTMHNWGNIIIPSFAVERTQELLCILKDMYMKKELPECKIFLDSPMATRATDVYNKYTQNLSKHCQDNKKINGTVFDFENLTYSLEAKDSMAINDIQRRAIIIAGSGMCTGGRILHHFKHRLWNSKNAVIFVGYQAVGTLGRSIVDGAKNVTIYGEDISIKASIHTINGFSAHADQKDILAWVSKIEGLKMICLVHGEKDKQEILQKVLEEKLRKKVHIVEPEEKIYL